MKNYLAIDIGGTFIKYAILNEQEQLIHMGKTSTNENEDQTILKQVKAIAKEYVDRFSLSGIGISTAGIVHREKGEVIYAGPTIPGYQGTNFKKELADFNIPVQVLNDVDAALLGELWKGAAVDYDDVYCLTLGTGIGGARYNRDIIDGTYLQANSIGYLLYDEKTETNYEMRASTKALNQKIATTLGEGLQTKDVFQQAKQGDASCEKVIFEWSKEVASGIAQIILISDPACIIIGGGISAQGDYLLQQIKQHVPTFLPKNFMKTEIKMALQQNNAALYGAVYQFLKQ